MNDNRHIIIFDGVCNLCEHSVQFIIKNDRKGKFVFVAGQSEKGRELQLEYGVDTIKDGTVILIKNNQAYIRSDAALEIAKGLNKPRNFITFLRLLPVSIRNYMYSIVSKNRYRWFGIKSECMVPDENIRDRFL